MVNNMTANYMTYCEKAVYQAESIPGHCTMDLACERAARHVARSFDMLYLRGGMSVTFGYPHPTNVPVLQLWI